MIQFRVLGSVDLRGPEGEEILSVLSRPKRTAFLAYLAVARPRGFHTRDKVLGLFWPELDQERARAALRTSLHFLRQSLGEDIIRSRGAENVGLDWGRIWCDVAALEEAVERGEMEEALELYRGDLLEGVFLSECPEFEKWLEEERERLREMAAGAAWTLAHLHIQEGRLVDAERAGQRALNLVGTEESPVRRFIEALADAGDRGSAVRFYEKFAEGLKRDLDLRPAAESRDLVDRIRASGEILVSEGMPPVDRPPADTPQVAAPPPASPGPDQVSAAEVPGESPPGTRLARLKAALSTRYAIEEEIGRGGMGTVYRAQDLKHHREVAVKALNPELAEALGAERFLREIETAANLTHPHILPLFDSGEADGFLFYVMPYVEGESLRSRLTKEKQLPVEDAIRITLEIADALAYAHERGVIHRDVKPANILLGAGHAVLADFGLAQAVSEAGEERITQTGVSLGTPAYMSPEQATGEQDLDGRSDQYALGCVLYEMLAGQPLFTGAQAESVVRQHLTADPPSVTQARPSVPEQTVKVINRSLAKSPADRFRTTGEMAAALALTTAPFRKEPRQFSKPLRTALGLFVLAVIAVVGTLILRPDGGTSPDSLAITQEDKPSIAVLPFDNLSPDPDDAYFTHGLHDQIITHLTKVSGLSVRGRTSVSVYRDSPKNLREIGEELNAQYIVEGGVQRAGGDVRINLQLIEAATDEHLWANTFDRTMSVENLLSVQTEIVDAVTDSVRAAVTPEEMARIEARPTDNPEAYDLYIRGVGGLEAGGATSGSESEESLREAVNLFQEAVRLDPGFGLAYAKLAYVHLYLYWWGFDLTEARVEMARRTLDQALTLSPDLGETYYSLGYYRYWVDRDYEGALEALEEARQRLPGDPDAYETIGYVIRRQGGLLESVRIHEEVFLLDPRNAGLAFSLSGTYGSIRNNEESALWAERAIDLGYGPRAATMAARAYLRAGDIDKARTALSRTPDSTEAFVIDTGFWVEAYARDYDAAAFWLAKAPGPILEMQEGRYPVAGYWGRLHRWAGRPELAQETFREAVTALRALGEGGPELAVAQAGLGEREAALAQINSTIDEWRTVPDLYSRPVPFKEMAIVQALLGEHDSAVDLLKELMSMEYEKALTVVDLRLDPTWDPLRNHPRFQALLEKYQNDVER